MANTHDTSWDNGGAARQGARKPWLKGVLMAIGLMIGVPLLITAAVGSLALGNRSKIWPAVRIIHARLQTDEGTRELFVKNPALAEFYASDQDFLDTVRAWRGKVGDLPELEPPRGPAYVPEVNPDEAAASVQGSGGAWMRVDIRGGTLAGPVEGEGIVRILFGEDRKALRSAQKKANALKRLRKWEDFRKLLLQCADDGEAAALYRRETGLHARYASEAAFLQAMRALRPAIAKVPAVPREASDEFGIRTYQTPFTHTQELIFQCGDGSELAASSKHGQLCSLELRPSTSPGAPAH